MSSPILSLRWLPEPAYIALTPAGGVPAVGYFARLRGRSAALNELARRGGSHVDLARMVHQGQLLELPSRDEAAVQTILADLTIQTPSPYRLAPEHDSALLRISDRAGRAVVVSSTTAEVLARSVSSPLGASVRGVADSQHLDRGDLWRGVIHDLTGVLGEGVGVVSHPPTS